MAYPTILNNQYKAEKAAGITSATSFPEWHRMHLAALALEAEQFQALESFLNEEVEVYTSEEIEAGYMGIKLNDAQIAAIVDTLNPAESPAEVTTPISKASHARAIYDQMDAAATSAKLTLVRKDVIQRFMVELPISKVGASTYLQNIKIKKGLINNK